MPSLEVHYQINNILRLMAKVSIRTKLYSNYLFFAGRQWPAWSTWWTGLWSVTLVCSRCLNRAWFQIHWFNSIQICLSGSAWEGWAARPEGGQGRVRWCRTERNQGKSLTNGRQHKMKFPFSLTSWWLQPENGSFVHYARLSFIYMNTWNCQLGGNLAVSGFIPIVI